LTAPGFSLHGALAFVGVNGVWRYQAQVDANNFAPRVGFSWRATPKTVIRSEAGLFYGTTLGVGSPPGTLGISGFDTSTSIVTSIDGVTPNVFLENPYPNRLNHPTGSSPGPATLLGQNIKFYDRRNITPYTIQWTFDVQREMRPSLLLDVAYIGTRGLKFPADLTLNQLPDSSPSLGNGLRTLVPNCFYGQIDVCILSAPTVAVGQLLRPYPQFDGVTSAVAGWAPSIYHALEVKVDKRYANGFMLLASYTYSKLMDFSTGIFNGETLGGGAIQDWTNLRAEYSISSLTRHTGSSLIPSISYRFYGCRKGSSATCSVVG